MPRTVSVQILPEGAWLAPGFMDLQVNGGGDVLLNDQPTLEGVCKIAAAHRNRGTTGLLPTLITDSHEKVELRIADGQCCRRPVPACSEFTSRGLICLPKSRESMMYGTYDGRRRTISRC